MYDNSETSNVERADTCLEKVAPRSPWLLVMHNAVMSLNYLRSDVVWNRPYVMMPRDDADLEVVKSFTERDEVLCLKINQDPIGTMDEMVEECLLYRYVLIFLAQYMSPAAVDKLCKKIFATKDMELEFVDIFYSLFIPNYLRRAYSWFAVDLLKRASVAFPEHFIQLAERLVQNTILPKNILKDFVVNIDETQRNTMMTLIASLKLTPHQFVHHLQTINFLFLESEKNDTQCDFVIKHLEENAVYCYNNKDFGRLLLSFMQNYSRFPVSHSIVRKLIEEHGTEFKSPCATAFCDIFSEILSLQFQLAEGPRIFINQPEEEASLAGL